MTVADRRKAIPIKVKLQVLTAQARCSVCGERLGLLAETRFDHRPPLVAREFDEVAGDFVPPQNDPDHMEACHVDCHLYRTVGRRPGATKTVTTRGSDVGEAARSVRIVEAHGRARKRESHSPPAAPPSRWPKRKMQSRPFRRAA